MTLTCLFVTEPSRATKNLVPRSHLTEQTKGQQSPPAAAKVGNLAFVVLNKTKQHLIKSYQGMQHKEKLFVIEANFEGQFLGD